MEKSAMKMEGKNVKKEKEILRIDTSGMSDVSISALREIAKTRAELKAKRKRISLLMRLLSGELTSEEIKKLKHGADVEISSH